jgi:hypothetical protein
VIAATNSQTLHFGHHPRAKNYLHIYKYNLVVMLRSIVLHTTSQFTLTARSNNVPSIHRAFISTTSVLRDQQALQEDIRSRLKAALKTAMKAKEKDTAGTIRVSQQRLTSFELGQVDLWKLNNVSVFLLFVSYMIICPSSMMRTTLCACGMDRRSCRISPTTRNRNLTPTPRRAKIPSSTSSVVPSTSGRV